MKDQEELQTYTIYLDCANCGERNKYDIKKGQITDEIPCKNCGCETLNR